jgi:molecular chaperone DnaK
MSGDPGDRRGGDRKPVGLLVRLAYRTVEDFRLRFAGNLSRVGVFVQTREPKSVGTAVAFELRLSTGEKVIRGEGVVRWIESEDLGTTPPRVPGMGIQFTRLDAPSRTLVNAIVAEREARGGAAPSERGMTTPLPEQTRAAGTPAPRAAPPGPSPPTLTRPIGTPVPASPGATATPAGPDHLHRVEQLRAGVAPVRIPLPAAPEPVLHPSRAVIGIDLGTTNSCAAVVRDGRPYIIPSREGYRTLPSIVALTSRQTLVVGHLARAQLLTNPAGTIHGAKRLLGRPFDSAVTREMRGKFPYRIVADDDGLAAVKMGDLTLSVEQVAALILREVKNVAQDHLGEEVNRAVITVPAYYNERQRQAVRHAAALAGLQVERILNEPTAAALAFGYGRHLQQRVLVYDLGGGTFDASVLELQDTIYEVVSTGGDSFLGGVDFDARIIDTLLQHFATQVGTGFGGDRVALSRLADAAERAKCALSERTEFPVQLPFLALHDGRPVSLEAVITREELERLVAPLVERTIEVCREVLAARSLSVADIDEVILVGGQSRMPLVHQRVAAFFGRPASRAVHPDEAVALGAALLAHSLGSAEGVVLIDVLPRSIGVALPGGQVKTILHHNTPLPIRKQYGLTTTRDGQTEFELVVVQGESEDAAECEYLGTIKLTGLPPGPRGMVKIVVTFELGAECLLTVTARESNTRRQVSVAMSTLPGPGGAQRQLERTTRTSAPDLSTGAHATVTPGPRDAATPASAKLAPTPHPEPVEPVEPVEAAGRGGDRLLGKLRRLFGDER